MLSITPEGKVVGSMPTQEKQRTPVLFDLTAESTTDRASQVLKLDVVFHAVHFKRPLSRGLWYAATTGAEIELRADGASILQYTDAIPLTVSHTNSETLKRSVGVEIKPTVEAEFPGAKAKVGLGELKDEHAEERIAQAQYTNTEPQLAVEKLGDTVVWMMDLPRGEKVVRDFLFQNLPLSAEVKWKDNSRNGSLSVLSTSIKFFDTEKRPLEGYRSLLAEFYLFCRGGLQNATGIQVNFQWTD